MENQGGVPANANTQTGVMQRLPAEGTFSGIFGIEEDEQDIGQYNMNMDNQFQRRGLAIIMTNDFQNNTVDYPPIPFVWRDGAAPAVQDQPLFQVTQDFMKIAENADILLGFATFQGNEAIGRRFEGSYYIDQLVKYLKRYHAEYDIHVILAGVCNGVQSIQMQTIDMHTGAPQNPSTRSQLPMVLSTLRKILIIRDGN